MKKILFLFGTRLEEVKADILKIIGTELAFIVDNLINYIKISLHLEMEKHSKIVNLIKENYAK